MVIFEKKIFEWDFCQSKNTGQLKSPASPPVNGNKTDSKEWNVDR